MTTLKCIVIQISQTRIAAGFNNQDLPELILPSQYLTYKTRNQSAEEDVEVTVFDKWEMLDACEKQGAEIYQLYDKNGLPNDWKKMDLQWKYMFERLMVQFQDYPLCLVLPTELSTASHKKLVEHLIGYGFPMVQLLNEPVCNVLSQGRSSGIVVDIGHCGVKVDVVIDGVLAKQCHRENKIGGAFLDWKICEQYLSRGSEKSTDVWKDAVEWLPVFKNTILQVSPIELDANNEVPTHYQHMILPMNAPRHFLLDKKTVTITNRDVYSISELLFKPSLANTSGANTEQSNSENSDTVLANSQSKPSQEKLIGIVGLVRKCVQTILNTATSTGSTGINTSVTAASQPADLSTTNQQMPSHNYTSEQLQSILLTNIVVTGNTSSLQGLEHRLLNDLSVALNDLTTVRLKLLFKQTRLDKTFQSWQSGSLICQLPYKEFLQQWETAANSSPSPSS